MTDVLITEEQKLVELYALRIRRDRDDLHGSTIEWLELGDQVIAFRRGATASVTNLGPSAVELPAHRQVLLSSAPLEGALLAPDSTVWLAL